MKKMIYLMMLVLGLSAVQTEAGDIIDRAKKKFEEVKTNSKKFANDFRAAKTPADKLNAMTRHAQSAIDNNKELLQELKKAAAKT